jgi:PIN domain nuclease of toxin-antitoxin system
LRLLLDTHVWIWSHVDPARLSDEVRAALLDEDAELWLSPISVWEARLLIEKGRLRIDLEPRAWLEEALRAAPLLECVVTNEVALAARELPLPHDDPADRFLAASAWIYDLTLVTADRRLLEVDAIRTLGAR